MYTSCTCEWSSVRVCVCVCVCVCVYVLCINKLPAISSTVSHVHLGKLWCFGGNDLLTKLCLLAKCIHSPSDDWFEISLSALLSVADVSDNNIKGDDIIILYTVYVVIFEWLNLRK